MKVTNAFLFFFFILSYHVSMAQKPQVILGIAKENKTVDYYEKQYNLWQKETKEDPENGFAWRQMYLAKRAYLQKTKSEVWRNNKPRIYKELDAIIAKARPFIDNTFEYYFIKAQNSSGKISLENSKKAYSLDSDRPEIYGWLFVDAVGSFQSEKAKELGSKMIHHNIYSNANLLWNLNSLNSMEKDAIFIGNGDQDILPKWVLQYGDNQRNDVLVISIWNMVNDKKYKQTVLNKIGMNEPPKGSDDFSNASDYVDYLTLALLKNGKRKAYMSSGSNVQFFKKHGIADNMYLVGNVVVYAENRFDNNKVLRANLKKYHLNHLIQNYQVHPEDGIIDTYMHLTYLPGIMNALEYYEKNKMTEEVEYYRKIIKAIASDSGKEKEVLSWYTPGK